MSIFWIGFWITIFSMLIFAAISTWRGYVTAKKFVDKISTPKILDTSYYGLNQNCGGSGGCGSIFLCGGSYVPSMNMVPPPPRKLNTI